MFRIKKILITIIVFASPFIVNAQRNEVGIYLGTSYYLGDLNPYKQFFLTKPAGGIIYRYIISYRLALKFDGLYGSVAGDDAKSKADVTRNLSFKSNIFEASSQLEYNFLPYLTGSKGKDNITPYIFAGLAIFHFNPQAEYNGVWYALQTLGTEGQRTSDSNLKPYSLTQVSIPFGLGIKCSIGNNFCVGAEWGLRKTFTGYIDDVNSVYSDPTVIAAENGPVAAALSDRSIKSSGQNDTGLKRGNGKPDWYSFAGAFITYRFKTAGDKSCPIEHNNRH
jgi:hypothetical protein